MKRPRIKPEHSPYRISGGRIRLGGLSYGSAAEVADPDGAVWTLLESTDGTRSREQIVARVMALHPAERPEAVGAALEQFVESGYVEDAGAPDPAELTERDKQRYDRGRRYFRWMDLRPRTSTWEPQLALRRARVTVAGLGGTGGHAALALAASGVGRLHCVDHDTVELSNLNRQILYTEDDIGRPKVHAAVRRLRRLNSDIQITGSRLRIEGVDDVISLAEECDVLVLAADHPAEIRTWVNRASLATGTPWVDGGYHGPQVSVGTYVPGKGACYECLRAGLDDERAALGADPDPDDGRRLAAAVANAVAAPSAGISGHLVAHAVLALLTDVPPAPVGRMHAVNLMDLGEPFVIDHPRRSDCPACGDAS
jgi:molybdopterin/thiamine biosynthesis adenylyltransferase